MLFLRIPSKYLRLEITEVDTIVSHKYRNQLSSHFAMGVFLAQKLIMGNMHDRHNETLLTLVLKRIFSQKPITLYNKAMSLIACGECEAAMVYLNQTIQMDHLPSHALKAWILLKGRKGVPRNKYYAFRLVEIGARLGCHHCQGVMAECYFYSFGFKLDLEQTVKLAHDSSKKGSRYGQYVLGKLICYGQEGEALDDAQKDAHTLELYQLAAAKNLDEAQWGLGHLYCYGRGVAVDYAEALRWYRLAAAQGHSSALSSIASCYKDGKGVTKDKAEAIRWYMHAQEEGCFSAASALQWLRT
jgi:TPR repeat protein